MRIAFSDLMKITNRYNASLIEREPKINLTEMAEIMDVECDVDLTQYDPCIDGTGCADCNGKACMSVFV